MNGSIADFAAGQGGKSVNNQSSSNKKCGIVIDGNYNLLIMQLVGKERTCPYHYQALTWMLIIYTTLVVQQITQNNKEQIMSYSKLSTIEIKIKLKLKL